MQKYQISYQQHKQKCIENAERIESAINQVTNLKRATNFVMTGKKATIVSGFCNGEASKEELSLSREEFDNAHVARIDNVGHRENFYISFSYKSYSDHGIKRLALIINKSQKLKSHITAYIFLTETDMYVVYPGDFTQEALNKKNYRELSYIYAKDAQKLENTKDKTNMDFTYLAKVDATKLRRTTGYFRCTINCPHGTVKTFEAASKRELYKQVFDTGYLDKVAYNTFNYHLSRGSWTITNDDLKIEVTFEVCMPTRKTRDNKKVKTIGEIEQIINEEIEKDETFLEDMEGAVVYDPKIIHKWLQLQPAELRTVASLRNFLQDPSLWNRDLKKGE